MKRIENWYNGLSDLHKLVAYNNLKRLVIVIFAVVVFIGLRDYSVLTHPHYYQWHWDPFQTRLN